MGGVFFYIFLSWLTLSISCSVCFALHSVSLILSVAVKIDQWKMLRAIRCGISFSCAIPTARTRAQAIYSHLLLIHSNLTHSIIFAFIFILIFVYITSIKQNVRTAPKFFNYMWFFLHNLPAKRDKWIWEIFSLSMLFTTVWPCIFWPSIYQWINLKFQIWIIPYYDERCGYLVHLLRIYLGFIIRFNFWEI